MSEIPDSQPAESAATRALLCPEILIEIFKHLTPGSPNKYALPRLRARRRENQKALARAACVCRAFSEPALDILWRVVDCLPDLLCVLPSFTLHNKKTYVLTRDISDEEWARFQDYARCVRELYTASSKPVSSSVYMFLAKHCQNGQGLLPQLQTLDSFCVRPNELGKILLLTPTLRRLVLVMDSCRREIEDPVVIRTILQMIQDIAIPRLESLRVSPVDNYLRPEGLNPEITPYVQLAHLQELELISQCVLDKPMLEELLGFPVLRKLAIAVKITPEILDDDAPLPAQGFKALRDLTVVGRTDSVTKFLQWTSPSSLEKLALKYSNRAQLIDSRVLEASAQSLRQLELAFTSDCLPNGLLDALRPALELQALTHVVVKIRVEDGDSLPVTNSDMRTLADAWPHLVHFEVNIDEIEDEDEVIDQDDAPVYPSPGDLVAFAERHPHLVRLVWPYLSTNGNGNDDPHWRTPGTVPALNHGLQVFRLCLVADLGSQGYRQLAMFLDRLFPSLDLSGFCCPRGAKSSEDDSDGSDTSEREYGHWCDVVQMLLAIRFGRETAVAY
ncbi:hypothetical protein C8Q77DRAFT_304933 [Trametes polyzona]|nr:hypothetical protein C8Q77DRAFT_304933 [Trametes polyzona]